MTKKDTPGTWGGALPLGQGVWAVPDVTPHASGRGPQDAARLGTGERAPEAARPGERLKQCAASCEDYAERVFAALHETPADDR